MIETSSLRRKLLDLAITGKLVPRAGEWKIVRLGEVCDILTGNVFDSRFFTQSGVKICGGLIIAPDRIVWEECKHWASTEGLEKYELAHGDVVVALDRPWILTGAKIGLIRKSDLPCLLIQRTARLRSKEIEPLFLKILLVSDDFKNHCVPTGSMLPHISHKDIASFEVPLPPLAEQKAIVKRLEELLALEREIAADSAAVDDLVVAAKRKVLELAVSGKLSAECEESAEWNDDRGEVEKCRDGATSLPPNWKMVKLDDVVELISGRDLPPSEYFDDKHGYPYITGASNFENGELLINRWTDTPVVVSDVGDLLITCKGSIGELSVNTIGKMHIARQVMAFRPTGISVNYLKAAIASMIERIRAKAHGVIPGIARVDVIDLPIPLPPLAEQKTIVAKVDELFAVLDAMKIDK